MFSFRSDIGIDLGTASVLVYVKNKGIVLQEPSVVAIDIKTDEILAVGEEARQMIGRTPSNIVAIRPLKDGVISDYDITYKMIKYFISKAVGKLLFKPRIIICVPSGVTGVEKRAVLEASMEAGAKKTYLIDEPIAAAIGAGLDITKADGHMIIDMGGGTTDIAVISLGGIVVSDSIKLAGNKIDDAITKHMRYKHNILIGERTAENIKFEIGTAYPSEEEVSMEVTGRNLVTGLPQAIKVGSSEILEAISETVNKIVEAIYKVLEQTPPEIAADIIDKGILLTGGGARLHGIDKLIKEKTGLDARIAENPILCVAIGTGKSLETINLLEKQMSSEEKSY